MRNEARLAYARAVIQGLYAVTPEIADTDLLSARVAAVLRGGARIVQYRSKTAPAALRRRQAQALRALTRSTQALLIVNDDAALAVDVGADGVHLGRDDAAVPEARRLLGDEALIGVSCYDSLSRADEAVAAGADYLAFGSAFPSSTKPGAVRAPLALYSEARRRYPLPIVAIGGIRLDNAEDLLRAGADALAVIAALFDAGDPGEAAARFVRRCTASNKISLTNLDRTPPIMSNEILFERAQRTIPAGVNSPVRAFRAVGGTPRFITRGAGARVWDVEGREYIDYVLSWGPLIAGHAHPKVVAAVAAAAQDGLSFGMPTEAEVELAERLTHIVPSMEMVRLVSSGTEATMSALRLARGFTGRSRIVKFEGCYHGHGDALLVKAGSGALTYGHPSSGGVPPEVVAQTSVLDYNDTAQLADFFSRMGDEVAAVILEPVAGNMNLVPGSAEFLQTARDLCSRHGAVLIFDEVMTGLRVHPGSAQGLYGIVPDLTTLGKVIGGGMPIGAFGGRRDIMQHIAPLGSVYQAGTLSGNPVAVAAGLATLQLTAAPGFYDNLFGMTMRLVHGLNAAGAASPVAFSAHAVGSMIGIYFRERPPTRYAEVMECDRAAFGRFFHAMLERGVHLAPSAFEAGFTSSAHGEAELAATLAAVRDALAGVGSR